MNSPIPIDIPIYSIALPEYTVTNEPDYAAVGKPLDALIEAHFPGRAFALRAVGLGDHPRLSLADLLARIQMHGTDRYDPERAGLDYAPQTPGNIAQTPGNIALHAVECSTITGRLCSPHYTGARCPDGTVLGAIINDFYHGARYDRGYAVRLDILLLYDLAQMMCLDTCLYTFRAPAEKQAALLGLIAILR